MKPRLTYANVMVTILAFIVLGGVAVAGVRALKKNSVGTRQLRNGAVTRVKIKPGAVDGSRVANGSLAAGDLNPSVLAPYLRRSELPGGNDVISPDPAAALNGAFYNVGNPGGVDCQGTDSDLPSGLEDDIVFASIGFDTAGLAHTEPGAVPDCYNGFKAPREGSYAISAWVRWEAGGAGLRKLALKSFDGKSCCPALAEAEMSLTTSVAMNVSAITRLAQGETVFLQGRQSTGSDLGIESGAIQIAWLGN